MVITKILHQIDDYHQHDDNNQSHHDCCGSESLWSRKYLPEHKTYITILSFFFFSNHSILDPLVQVWGSVNVGTGTQWKAKIDKDSIKTECFANTLLQKRKIVPVKIGYVFLFQNQVPQPNIEAYWSVNAVLWIRNDLFRIRI